MLQEIALPVCIRHMLGSNLTLDIDGDSLWFCSVPPGKYDSISPDGTSSAESDVNR
jgi:hypothetical protein